MRSGKQKTKRIKKLNKIYGFACAVLIAICFAFSTANYVHAEENIDIEQVSNATIYFGDQIGGYSYLTYGIVNNNHIEGYFDIYRTLRTSIVIPNKDDNYAYFGYGALTTYIRVSRPTVTNVEWLTPQLIDIEHDVSGSTYVLDSSWSTVSGGQRLYCSLRQMLAVNELLPQETQHENWTFHVRQYFKVNSTSLPSSFGCSLQLDNASSGNAYIFKTPSSYFELHNIEEFSYQMSGLLNDLYLEEVSQGETLALILYQLRTMNNSLSVDSSVVEDTDDKASEIADINDSVDTAIASAAPDSAQEISAVGQMIQGHGTFWSAQQNAVTFWKDAINYAFDFSVVSYLATGLSIVLIIILFIFVLRL